MQARWWRSKTETCRSDIYVYFNVNFNVFFQINKNCICWWVNSTYISMYGTTIKKINIQNNWVQSYNLIKSTIYHNVLQRAFYYIPRRSRYGPYYCQIALSIGETFHKSVDKKWVAKVNSKYRNNNFVTPNIQQNTSYNKRMSKF